MTSKSLLLCSVLLVAAGCGKIPDAGPDAAPPDPCTTSDMELDEFFDCLVESECKLLVPCTGLFPDVESCKAGLVEQGEFAVGFRRISDGIEADRASFDGEEALACLAAIDAIAEAGTCQLDFQACNGVFAGQIGTGGVCFLEEECEVEGSSCATGTCDLQCCPGSCNDPLAIGQPCGGNAGNCVPGARCAFVGSQQVCVSGDAGTPCAGNDGCDRDLYCDTASSKCVAAGKLDAVCVGDSQCEQPLLCVGDSLAATGFCALADSAGKSCDGRCSGASLFCDQPDPAMLGTCKLLPHTAGDDCSVSQQCQQPLRCDNTTKLCVAPVAEDGACKFGGECQRGLHCTTEIDGSDAGTCQAPLPAGSTCTSSSHCESNVCASQDNGSMGRVCQDYETCG